MKKRILLVDDSATALHLEKMVLDRQPYELAFAHDGQDAMEKARAQPPDLIVLDVIMPRMDGFETLRRIRADEALHAIPVIMVTTRSETDNVERGYVEGCNDYITKPISGPEFLGKIRELLGA